MKKRQKSKRMLLTALIVLAIPLVLAGTIAAVVLQLVANGRMPVFAGTLCLIFVLVVVFIVALCMIRQLLGRIHNLVGNLEQIADGMLSMKEDRLAERGDEIGQMMRSVNGMVVSFAKIITSARDAAESLIKISEDYNHSFQEMDSSMQQVGKEVNSVGMNAISQSERTQEFGVQIIEMSNTIDAIVQNMNALTGNVDKMRECCEMEENIRNELVSINEAGSKAIADVHVQLDAINQSAVQIRTVTEILTGISNQTNLLALNASIEAARAGDMNTGYAAAAEEIRTLADQSRESSEKINAIVNELIENSNVSVNITRKVTGEFERQAEKISQTEGIFISLNQEILQAMDVFGEIVTECKGTMEQRN